MSDDEIRPLVHDLNNLFTRILTTAELIESQGSPGDQVVVDARTIRDATLEGRDIAAAIRAAAIRTAAITAASDEGVSNDG
jgi:hypothetical protein